MKSYVLIAIEHSSKNGVKMRNIVPMGVVMNIGKKLSYFSAKTILDGGASERVRSVERRYLRTTVRNASKLIWLCMEMAMCP